MGISNRHMVDIIESLIPDPTAVDGYCREDKHCDNIQYSECISNATCQCDYKHKHNKDGTVCEERKLISLH